MKTPSDWVGHKYYATTHEKHLPRVQVLYVRF